VDRLFAEDVAPLELDELARDIAQVSAGDLAEVIDLDREILWEELFTELAESTEANAQDAE
jgi:hypothetical protein